MAERIGKWSLRCVSRAYHRLLENALDPLPRERRVLCKDSFVGVANHHGRQRSQCDTMGTECEQTELEGKNEPFAPLAARNLGCLLRKGLRQLVVQREHDGALVGEVPVQQRGAHPGPRRHIAQRSRLITTLANQGDRRLVKP